MEEKLLTRRQAGELLGISPWTVRRWEKEGKLHAIKFNCSNVRIKLSEVQALMNGSAQ